MCVCWLCERILYDDDDADDDDDDDSACIVDDVCVCLCCGVYFGVWNSMCAWVCV